MKLIDSKTYKNLAKSYAGESQAYIRYKFIEYGARIAHFGAVAELVDKVVYNEFNHARMFYTKIQDASKETIENIDIASGYPFKQKWDFIENLRLASEDEHHEATIIYPQYMKVAREEGFEDIAKLYEDIIQVETCHYSLFTQLYEQLKYGTMYKKSKPTKWKCGDCGYEATAKEAWDKCPLCNANQGQVLVKIEDNA